MASQVQICNLALLKFGDIAITSIDDATKEARACKALWDTMRDELLYGYPWNFALKRADLGAPLSPAPAFGFSNSYSLPADCLRVWELYGSASPWTVEGRELLTDDEEAKIRYIAQITDTAKLTPAFADCLSTRLAAELAAKIGGDKGMRQALLQELYRVDLPKAYKLDALEGSPPRHTDEQELDKGNYTWQREGR